MERNVIVPPPGSARRTIEGLPAVSGEGEIERSRGSGSEAEAAEADTGDENTRSGGVVARHHLFRSRSRSTTTPDGRPDGRPPSASAGTVTRMPVSRAFRNSVIRCSRRACSPRDTVPFRCVRRLPQQPGARERPRIPGRICAESEHQSAPRGAIDEGVRVLDKLDDVLRGGE